MKKMLLTLAAIVMLVLVVAVALAVLWPKPTDPTIAAARQQAELAAIARQQGDSEFWGNLFKFGGLAALVLVLVAGGGVLWAFLSGINHARRVEIAKVKIEAGLLRPDDRGNYPVLVNRQTGDYTRPRPGNPAYPEQVHFVNGLQPQPLDRPGRSTGGRSLTTRAYGRPTAYYSSVEVVTPDQIEAPAEARKVAETLQQPETGQPDNDRDLQDLQPEIYGKFTDLLPQIETAIKEGRGKTDTLKTLGLGGRYYKEAGQLWEEVTARLAKEQTPQG